MKRKVGVNLNTLNRLKGASALVVGVSLFAGCTGPSPSARALDVPPRLVLQITIDQLRGDLPFRYYNRFGEGGFRYLIEPPKRIDTARLLEFCCRGLSRELYCGDKTR